MKKQLTALAAGAVLLATAQNSYAGSAPIGSITPSMTLENSCIAGVIAGQDFGTHPTTAADLTDIPAGKIEVACSNSLAYRILLNAGLYPQSFGAAKVRRMQGGNVINKMPYALYYNYPTEVGDNNPYDLAYPKTMPLVPGISATGNGDTTNLQTYNLRADVYITSSSMAVDDYTDRVTVTIQWP